MIQGDPNQCYVDGEIPMSVSLVFEDFLDYINKPLIPYYWFLSRLK